MYNTVENVSWYRVVSVSKNRVTIIKFVTYMKKLPLSYGPHQSARPLVTAQEFMKMWIHDRPLS